MKKATAVLTALVLVFSVVMSTSATNFDALMAQFNPSYDFEMTMEISIESNIDDDELQGILALISGSSIGVSGTVDTINELALQMFYAMNVDVPALGIPMTFNYWIDMDLNDLENPTYLSIMETPEMLRLLMVLGGMPEFASQFFVMDMDELIVTMLEEMEGMMYEFGQMLLEYEEMIEEFEEMLEEILAAFHDEEALIALLDEFFPEWEEVLTEVLTFIEESVEFDFDFNFEPVFDGDTLTEIILNFACELVVTVDGEYIAIQFAFDFHVFNIGNPSTIIFPEINEDNSIDLLDLIMQDFPIEFVAPIAIN